MSPAHALLTPFREAGILQPIDWQFAQAMAELVGEAEPDVVLAAALASRAPREGHIHVALRTIGDAIRLESAAPAGAMPLPWPDPVTWLQHLSQSALVSDGETATPLVLEGDRLYLRRYWAYQRQLASVLQQRATSIVDVPEAELKSALLQLFPLDPQRPEPNRQRLAALMAVLRRLAIITGGPGTGKTTTVVRVLALLIQLSERPLRIALAAPTGKAAARMAEAIRHNLSGLDLPAETLAAIPTTAVTLHRLLGYQHHRPTQFRHHGGNPLPFDVVIVDEASMVSLAQMAKLVDAVSPDARLILLGDRDQLASVEAGSVLADLCAPTTGHDGLSFSADFAKQLTAHWPDTANPIPSTDTPSSLRDSLLHLNVSHRFDASSGIGQLAAAINRQDADAAFAVLRDPAIPAVELIETPDPVQRLERLRQFVVAHFPTITAETAPTDALQALSAICVLCAHRQGQTGIEGLNRIIQTWLHGAGKIKADDEWFVGRPVMITQNDHRQQLYNGDIGIVLPDPDQPHRRRVYFPSSDGDGFRSVAPPRLPPHETVFAMTVHKSQGSEFERVVLVLPEKVSPVLTKELLYTGITRSKQHVTLIGPEAVITAGIQAKVQRASGLQERLWGV